MSCSITRCSRWPARCDRPPGARIGSADTRMDNDNDEDDEFVIQIWAPGKAQPFQVQ